MFTSTVAIKEIIHFVVIFGL